MRAILEMDMPESCADCKLVITKTFKFLHKESNTFVDRRKNYCYPLDKMIPDSEEEEYRADFCPLRIVDDMKTAPMPQISLRDYFAGQALSGLLAGDEETSLERCAKWAFKNADAMMKAREVKNE